MAYAMEDKYFPRPQFSNAVASIFYLHQKCRDAILHLPENNILHPQSRQAGRRLYRRSQQSSRLTHCNQITNKLNIEIGC
jgi:hypothetical protein